MTSNEMEACVVAMAIQRRHRKRSQCLGKESCTLFPILAKQSQSEIGLVHQILKVDNLLMEPAGGKGAFG